MNAPTLNAADAAQLLATRAAPLLKAWDDLRFHNGALAGLIGAGDPDWAADIVSLVRSELSGLSERFEPVLEYLRHRTARDANVAVESLPSVDWMLVNGERVV